MKQGLLSFLVAFLVVGSHESLAQTNYITLEASISRPSIRYNHVSIKLTEIDGKCQAVIRSDSKLENTGIVDTVYEVEKAAFDKLSSLALSLSSVDLLKGMNPEHPYLYNDGIGCTLTISIFQEHIRFAVVNPMSRTRDRNLEKFVQVLKEMLLMAQLNPQKVLR